MTARRQMLAIDAPHMGVALIFEDGVCVEAAPIIAWARGRSLADVQAYSDRKRWKSTLMDIKPKPSPKG